MTIIRLWAFILVSCLIHLLIIYKIPQYKPAVKPEDKIIDVAIVTTVPDKGKNSEGKNPSVVDKGIEKVIGKGLDIDIPDVADIKDLDIEIPDLDVSKLDNPDEKISDKSVNKEIDSSGDDLAKKYSDALDADITGEEKRFFKLNNMTNGARKLVFVPKRPVFNLTQDTKVILKFNVDKTGNTYGIVLLTRTESDIEKIAVDFVKKLKFAVSDYEKADAAEIILYFRVK